MSDQGHSGGRSRGPFDPDRLFQALHAAAIDYILVGGLALGAHGAPRGTKDLDICPDPDEDNLRRLAQFLESVHAKNVDEDQFSREELPAHDLEGLRSGGNLRLNTDLGPLDVMQYLEPFGDDSWSTLDNHAETRHPASAGVTLRVCSYEDLLKMKVTADRGQDRIDVSNLKAARREL